MKLRLISCVNAILCSTEKNLLVNTKRILCGKIEHPQQVKVIKKK